MQGEHNVTENCEGALESQRAHAALFHSLIFASTSGAGLAGVEEA